MSLVLGCDFKLHNEDCANQCKSKYPNEQEADSCQVGCTLGDSNSEKKNSENPIIAVDPVPVRRFSMRKENDFY